MFSIDAPMPESDVAELVELPATARGVKDAVQLGWFSLHSLHPAKQPSPEDPLHIRAVSLAERIGR